MQFKPIFYMPVLIVVLFGLPVTAAPGWAQVLQKGGQTYLVDRTGEHWDISQAVSIGFDPQLFEFGIGRHAFQTLDGRDWQPEPQDAAPGLRVIGIAKDDDAHAYSVGKLRYHETANTLLGDRPIVVGY